MTSFFQRLGTQAQWNDAKPTDNPPAVHYLLLFTIKFYFWGIAAVSRPHSYVVRMVSQLGEMQWKCHYSEHTLEKMLAPGQIKRLLLNRNRLVRILVWKRSTGGGGGGGMSWLTFLQLPDCHNKRG